MPSYSEGGERTESQPPADASARNGEGAGEGGPVRTLCIRNLPMNVSAREVRNLVALLDGYEAYSLVSVGAFVRFSTADKCQLAKERIDQYVFDESDSRKLTVTVAHRDLVGEPKNRQPPPMRHPPPPASYPSRGGGTAPPAHDPYRAPSAHYGGPAGGGHYAGGAYDHHAGRSAYPPYDYGGGSAYGQTSGSYSGGPPSYSGGGYDYGGSGGGYGGAGSYGGAGNYGGDRGGDYGGDRGGGAGAKRQRTDQRYDRGPDGHADTLCIRRLSEGVDMGMIYETVVRLPGYRYKKVIGGRAGSHDTSSTMFVLFDSAAEAQGGLARLRGLEVNSRMGMVRLDVEVAKRSLVIDQS